MKTEKENIICDYCKKKVPEQKDAMPMWFGRYKGEIRIETICVDCLPKNRDKWTKGGKS